MKKTEDAPVAAAPVVEGAVTETAIAVQAPAVLPPARREQTGVMATTEGYDQTDTRGKEGITSEDLRLPFLAIAQKTSKAIDPTEGTFIDGLKFMELYNTETRVNYGAGPIKFLPLMHRKRAHLRGENGLLQREPLAWDDPRVTWDGARAAGQEKPEGLRIYDWVVLLLPNFDLVVISFMSKGFPAGQSLTTFVQMRQGPAFSGQYELLVGPDQNESGKFGKFLVRPAGKAEPQDAEFAAAVYETVKGKTLVVDVEAVQEREPGSDDGPQQAGSGATAGAAGGKAPF